MIEPPPRLPLGAPSAISADLMKPPSPGLSAMMLGISGLVVIFIAWAALAVIEEVTTGRGRVIPASKIQLVQNLEGGIVREILVREGQRVVEGDVLLRIDPTLAGSTLGEAREKMQGLTALIVRLDAEVDGKLPSFPSDLSSIRPDLVEQQREQYEARKRELDAAINAFDQQEQQRAQELVELAARIATLTRARALAQEEADLVRPLAQSRAVARSDIIAVETKLNEIEGSLKAAELARPRVESTRREIIERRAERLAAFRSDALQRLAAARLEFNGLTESSRSSADRVARTTIRAPTTGIVKTVHVTTPGQVVQPGHNMVEIVPLNDTLLVEAQIRPQDIAFLRPGQRAVVKITAYDFALYGGLEAEVEQIGADSIVSERGEIYYLIRVRTARSALERDGDKLPIMPGMVADVDIITGAKTVLEFVTRPLTRMRYAALRER